MLIDIKKLVKHRAQNNLNILRKNTLELRDFSIILYKISSFKVDGIIQKGNAYTFVR